MVALALIAVSSVGVMTLAGCSAAGTDRSTHASSEATTAFDRMDIMFAEMMIPHHSQAVTMSDYALSNTTDAEVLALAEKIKAAQAPEITQMEGWLTASGIDPTSVNLGEHAMHMDGMLSDAQLAELKAATGAEFDKLYLTYMIQHHEGAITMAHMVINSANPEAKKLGEAITSTQQQEIDYMKQLLTTLGG